MPPGQPRSGVKPTPNVYNSLLSSRCHAGEYSACFAELRKNFVNTRPAKLKNLILLVKHWYRQVRPLGGWGGPAFSLRLVGLFFLVAILFSFWDAPALFFVYGFLL